MKRTFLKVMSIIMIVCAALIILVTLISIAGVAALVALGKSSTVLYAAIAIMVAECILEMWAGVVGVVASGSKPEKVNTAFVFGIILTAIAVISLILNIVGNGTFKWTDTLSLIVPVLYLISAIQAKKH